MKNPKPIATVVALMLLFSASTFAQQALKCGGGDAAGAGGSASFTVGQIFYTTEYGEGGSFAQGVQQPFEIWVVTSVDDFGDINLTTTVYPNPTVQTLNLRVEGVDFEGVYYQLYDLSGRLLKSDKVSSSVTRLDMSQLAASTYLLIVFHKNREIKSFKILKNQ